VDMDILFSFGFFPFPRHVPVRLAPQGFEEEGGEEGFQARSFFPQPFLFLVGIAVQEVPVSLFLFLLFFLTFLRHRLEAIRKTFFSLPCIPTPSSMGAERGVIKKDVVCLFPSFFSGVPSL